MDRHLIIDGIESISIADFSPDVVPRGTMARFRLGVEGALHVPVSLPALVANGARPGPVLLAVAGVHGDEYEGMEAIRQVFADLDPARLRGIFVGIPVANPFAYEARTRAAPAHLDGLNLARIFPGDPQATPSGRLAHELLSLVLRTVAFDDLFVDFHSGSADVPFAPLVGFRDVNQPATVMSEEAARHFGLPRLWRIPDADGPFNAEMARRNVPTIGTETTGRAGCDPDDVARFAEGLRNLLAWKGMLPGMPVPPRIGTPARTTIDVLAPATGFLRMERRLLEEVTENALLGTLVTPYGDAISEIRAPMAGTIWACRSMPAVRAAELVCMIALPD